MDLPRRFAYGPQWPIILLFFAASVLVLALVKIHWMSFGVGIAFGILPAVFASLLTVRRFAFPRFLEVERDAISIPTGFFHIRTTKIPYADIVGTREIRHNSIVVSTAGFCLYLKGRGYSFSSTLLPDMTSYVAIRNFASSRLAEIEKTRVCQHQSVEGGKYSFQFSYAGNGAIYNSVGEVLWRVKTLHPNRSDQVPASKFYPLPDFAVYDTADRELFRIKSERRLPLAKFVMVGNGLPVCTIRQRSILLNKYTLDFANGQKWVFRMPLFTVNFGGLSEMGEKIRVRLWTHNVWYVLIDTNVDSPQLVAALAFIH